MIPEHIAEKISLKASHFSSYKASIIREYAKFGYELAEKEFQQRIAELEAEIETLKNSETLHNEYMKGFGAGYYEGLYDGLNR